MILITKFLMKYFLNKTITKLYLYHTIFYFQKKYMTYYNLFKEKEINFS